MRRLPQIAFGLLALATLGAFFLIQSLKTANPLLWNPLNPKPAAINPIHGRPCVSRSGELLNYRRTQLTLAVSHSDTVGVYIVTEANAGGAPVATITAGTPMTAAPGPANAALTARDSRVFTWNGRLADGQPAPQGTYYFRIVLQQQDRSINLSQTPVQVITQPPHPRILSVRVIGSGGTDTTTTGTTSGGTGTTTTTASSTATSGTSTRSAARRAASSAGPAVLSPPHGRLRITFTPYAYRRVWIDIYRTDVAGRPELVDILPVKDLTRNTMVWDGRISGEPAPAGTYLVGITAQDLACNRAGWPLEIPPVAGTTPHAGVTISYLSVTPPLTPTVSGASAGVSVDAPGAGFSWRLRRSGSSRVLARGRGAAGLSEIHVPMPRHVPGLYTLTVRSDSQSVVVPLAASQAGRAAAHARVLVVLPMLTWMGNTPVDDSGDGMPDTLRAGQSVSLSRPLVDGPPAGFADDVALLAHLRAEHMPYQLTTDVALAEGVGPSLADRGGVIFPAAESFMPASLEPILRGFVRGGGRVLVLGTGSFSGVSRISGFPAAPRAGQPQFPLSDPFGAQRGPITPAGGQLISELADPLAVFGGATAFSGFGVYQPIHPPGAASGSVSIAGIGSGAPAIAAFHYGTGTVIEVGLPGFAMSLAHNADSAMLLANVWQLLAR